jgi:multisubunit Na+/H+ antiporter MnhE subunit
MSNLLASFLISWVLLLTIEPVFDKTKYASRGIYLVLFLFKQVKSMATSSLQLMFNIITRRHHDFTPRLITLDTRDYNSIEVMLVSYSINLSPGTAVVSVDKENRILHIHVLDSDDEASARDDILKTVIAPILRFTRV